MKANRFTEEQIVRDLKEVETGEKKAADQQREMGISVATWYIWKRKYGGQPHGLSHTHAGKGGGERGLKKALRPSQRREMVGWFRLQGLSHRQSCRLAGLSRSVDKYSASTQPTLAQVNQGAGF